MADETSDHLCYNAARAPCAVCGKEGLPCARCRLDYYCGKQHQRQDWQRHKAGCGAVEVREDAQLGRHLVLTKDVPAGTVLLRELPLLALVPPWIDYDRLYCVGCHSDREVQFGGECARCGWPVCSAACSKSKAHQAECKAFQEAGFKLTFAARKKAGTLMWLGLSALRTHLASQTKPRLQRLQSSYSQPLEAFGELPPITAGFPNCGNTVLGLNDAVSWRAETSAAKRQGELWPAAARWLRDVAGLKVPEEDLVRAAGVNDINAINLNPVNCVEDVLKGKMAAFLFSGTSLCEHSCVPTGFLMAFSSTAPSYEHVVVATRDLHAGEHLSLDYVDSAFQDAATRHMLLRRGWSFVCRCDFCRDLTAGGLHIGAPCCPTCTEEREEKQLMVAETEPTAESGDVRYRCRGCGSTDAPSTAEEESELQCIKSHCGNFERFDERLEDMLWPRGTLHPDHRLVLNAHLGACLMTRMEIVLQKVKEPELTRRLGVVEHLLDAMKSVKPGFSHHHWAMHIIVYDLLYCSLESGGPPGPNRLKIVKERILLLQKEVEILRPYFISPPEKEHHWSTYERPANVFASLLDKL